VANTTKRAMRQGTNGVIIMYYLIYYINERNTTAKWEFLLSSDNLCQSFITSKVTLATCMIVMACLQDLNFHFLVSYNLQITDTC